MSEHDPVGMYELLDAVQAAIEACDPAKREALAQVLDAYSEDSPDDFFWAIGPQAPAMLYHLMMTINFACRANGGKKRNVVVRLVDRKPEGNA